MTSTRHSRTPSWALVAALSATLTIEGARLPVGGFSVQIGQLLCLALLFFGITQGWILRDLFSRCLGFAALFFLLALPSVLDLGFERVLLPIQFGVNILVFAAIASAAARLSPEELDKAVRWVLVAVAAMAFLSLLFLSSGDAKTEPRLLGIPRSRAFFSEPTWFALMTAGLALIAIQRRLRWSRRAATVLVVGLWTRAAVILTMIGWLAELGRSRRIPRALPMLAIALLWLLALWQLTTWVTTDPALGSRSIVSTLAQRAWDIAATKEANDGDFFPYGGEQLEIFDVYRDRTLPSTSNVLPFDLVWKLGLGGIVMALALCFFFLRTIPTTLRLRLWEMSLHPAGTLFLMLLPVCVFNNAFGRPWLWALLGLSYAALRLETRAAEGSVPLSPPSEPARAEPDRALAPLR